MASNTNPYAPKVNVECPSDNAQLFRTFFPQNQTLHPDEQAYVQERQTQILDAWQSWIQGPEIGYNTSLFQSYPTVGMGISGGGFRASLFGAGVLNAYDARNATAKALGTGGLYNVATYIAGASGGSWAVASQLFNPDAKSYYDLVLGVDGDEQGWLLDINVAFPNGDNFLDSKNEEFYGAIVANAKAKSETSVPTSITDIWAGLLSYHFLNGTTRDNFFTNATHGAGLLWSDIPSSPLFQSHALPFPVVISDSRSPSSTGERPTLNDVVYEISPFEFGSWDSTISSMVNLRFAGTNLNEGKPTNSTSCVTGFDQAAYIIGTSRRVLILGQSAAFILTSEVGSVASLIGPLGDTLEKLIAKIVSNGEDTALWPNSFGGLNRGVFLDALSTNLHLDDGGENAENVPIEPLMLKPRNMDVVVAIDSTAETTLGTKHNFPNGTSMNTAATRLQTILSNTHQQAPPMPPDFAITGNNLHVSFFGCDPTQDPPEFPLIIYVPNSPPCTGVSPVTNTGAFQLSYSVVHQQQFFNQTFLGATCGFVPNTTSIDVNFPICLKCAAIDRARFTTNPPITRSALCQQCFNRYCFNPSDPPSNKDFPGRQFIFVDPTPSTLSKTQAFIQKDGLPFFIVLGIVLVLSFGLCGFCAFRRKKIRTEKIELVRKYGWGALAGVERLEASDNKKKRGFFSKLPFMNNISILNRNGKYGQLSEEMEMEIDASTPSQANDRLGRRSSWVVPPTLSFTPTTAVSPYPSNPFADTPNMVTHDSGDLPVFKDNPPAVEEHVSSPTKYDDPYEAEFDPYK